MNAPVSTVVLLDTIKAARLVRSAEENLSDFAKQAWHVLEPSTELKWGWALDAICEHLEAVTDGELTRLLMNVPPGSMKSLLTGVIFPAWEWGPQGKPGMRYLSTAHKQDLAVRDNLKCRRLIQSPWFQERWPVKLTSDQNAKTKFENDKTGFREAMAFTSMTGSRGDRVILDDPLSVDDAYSDAAIDAAEATFREALPTRVNNDESAIIVIMQRLNEKDTSGIILKEKLGYTHLCLPMRFEKSRRCTTSLGFEDPRKEEGELLFPERFSAKTVDMYEKTLGEMAFAGQMQQAPAPTGGGILKVEHFKKWPADKAIPALDYVIQSYDTAFTEKTTGDPTGCEVWGMFQLDGEYNAILLDCWDEHLGYPALRKKAIDDYGAVYGASTDTNPPRKGRKADRVVIEAKASGQSLLQDLWLAKVPIFGYNPGNADKVARAHQASPTLELGVLWIPESKKNPGHFVSWAQPMLAQLAKFPAAEHDEYVDCFSQAIIYLKDNGWFDLKQAEDEELEEVDYAKKKRVNPYGS